MLGFACIKRVAVTADFHADFRHGRPAGPGFPASAFENRLWKVLWVYVGLHIAILFYFCYHVQTYDKHGDAKLRGHDQGWDAFWAQKDHFSSQHETLCLHGEGTYLSA